MSNDKFEWNDELVLKFAHFTNHESPTFQGRYADLEQFKQEQLSKRDWEIVGMISPTGLEHPGDKRCETCGCKIHSVRRLSDGEIFVLGDEIEWGSCSLDGKMVHHKEKIVGFEIKEGDMYAIATGQYLVHYKILQKAKKQVLFTTDDFVDVVNMQEVWVVRKDFRYNMFTANIYDNCNEINLPKVRWRYGGEKYFSTREAAEEYILMNKPMLSVNDFIKTLGQCATDKYLIEELKQLAKSKMDKK